MRDNKPLCIKLGEISVEEAFDAVKYAKCAVEHKNEYPTLADVMLSISLQELTHMDSMYKEGLKLVEKHPENKAVFDYLHDMAVEKAMEAKSYQALYRN